MKSKILTRFELFCNGESQRIGFIKGLDETGISSDLESSLIYRFNKELPLPPSEIFNVKLKDGQYIASYFTEKGLDTFGKEIKNIVNAICDEGIYSVGKIVTTIDPEHVLYQDDFQVVQISQDLTDISSAIISATCEDGCYEITSAPEGSIISVVLDKLECSVCDSYNIIVNPFYSEGEMIYYINTKKNIVKLSSEKIY